jgi:hypothetical protein
MTTTTIRGEPSGHPATRALGGSVAAFVAAVPAALGFASNGDLFLAAGIPAAMVVGIAVAPQIRSDRPVGHAVFLMATAVIAIVDAVVLIGLWVWSALISPGAGSIDPGSWLIGFGMLWLIGLFFGAAMLVITTPCAIAWALIVRQLVRRGHGVAA